MEIQGILKNLREKNNLTQEQLAERVQVTRQAVSRWETGETQPNTDTLKLLSRVFDVSINTLLGSPRQLVCQCCGMPLNEDGLISREPDGSYNEDYCKWCYQELYNNLVRYHSHDNVTYIFGDFLKYKLPLNRRYKIFSNIPFQITADIIRKLTDDVNPPSDINIIIQREAAKKNCGIPLQKYEGFRAAIIKAQYKVEITHSFKRSDFFPSPNVDTVMLHMQLWDDRLSGDDLQNYKDLVAFFYTNIKGETAKERLSILFSNEQIKRLGKANRISLSNSYTLITAEQWMNIYYYSKIGLTDEKKKKFQDAYKKLQKMNKKLKKQNRTSLRKSSSNKKCRTRIDTSNGTKNR